SPGLAPVAVPVDDERIAMPALDSQRLPAGLDDFGFGPEPALALSLEPVERTGEVAHDQIEVTIAIPIDGERPPMAFTFSLIGLPACPLPGTQCNRLRALSPRWRRKASGWFPRTDLRLGRQHMYGGEYRIVNGACQVTTPRPARTPFLPSK